MGVILVVLLLALVFFGLGFAVHLLWIVAVVLFLAWVAGLAFRRGSTSRRVRR
ncbi:MAG: hydrophobic protein [Acidimicrobiales bacterium]